MSLFLYYRVYNAHSNLLAVLLRVSLVFDWEMAMNYQTYSADFLQF